MTTYRIKDVARINTTTLPESTDPYFRFRYIDISAVDELGGIVIPDEYTTFAAAPSRARRIAPPGSVIVSTVRTYLRAVASVPATAEPLVFSTGFAVLEAGDHIDARYLSYYCRSDPFIHEISARSVGVSYPAINAAEIGNLPINLPPLEEQRRIADFLDAETDRIDQVRARFLELDRLLASRSTSISESLIGNLVGDGAIGATRVKYCCSPIDEKAGSSDWPLLAVSIHRGVVPRAEFTDRESRADSFENYKTCEPGDIILNRMRAFQGAVGVTDSHGLVSPDYLVLRPARSVNSVFLHYLFRSPRFVAEMASRIRGIGSIEQGNVRTPRINWEDLGDIRVSIPSLSEQRKLAERLGAATAKISSLRQKVTDQLHLLAERRQALITAAVTGQIDVSTARGRGKEECAR